MTVEKAEQILNSWKRHANYACSYTFIKKLINKYEFLYMGSKDTLKVDISKIGG